MNPCTCSFHFGLEQLFSSSLQMAAIQDRLLVFLGQEEFSLRGNRSKLVDLLQGIMAQMDSDGLINDKLSLIPPVMIPNKKAVGVLSEAEKRLDDLKGAMRPLTEDDNNKCEELKAFKKMAKPGQGEAETLYQLANAMSAENAVVFHSLQRAEYFKMLDEKVKAMTHGKKETDDLPHLQVECAKFFNIGLDGFETELKKVDMIELKKLIGHIKSCFPSTMKKKDKTQLRQHLDNIWNGAGIPLTSAFLVSMNDDIKRCLSYALAEDKIWTLFNQIDVLTVEQIRNVLKKIFYKMKREASKKEVDIFSILTEKKILLQVEVKTAMESRASVLAPLKSASKQNHDMLAWVRQMYQGTLDEEWMYIKVAAVPQTMRKDVTGACANGFPCNNCHDFIITEETVDTCAAMKTFLAHIFQKVEKERNFLVDKIRAKKSADILIGHLMASLIIGEKFYVTLSESAKQTAQLLVGELGVTAGGAPTEENVIDADVAIKELEGVHLGSLKNIIFWNLNQWRILHSNILRLLFIADFGAGKTILLKQIARWLADPSSSLHTGHPVVYLCLAAADSDGTPWACPTVMDIANKVDCAHVPGVTVMSAPDLALMLNDYSSDVAQLLQKYNQLYPDRHLIVDEMPIGADVSQIKKHSAVLTTLYSRPATAHTCIAVRSAQAVHTNDAAAVAAVHHMKNQLGNLNVHMPELPHNMRNSGTVVTLASQLDFNQARSSVSPGKPLGGHTVPGPRPFLITVDNVNKEDSVKQALSEAIIRLGLSSTQPLATPVVVLCSDSGTSNTCRRVLAPDTTVYLPSLISGRDLVAEDAVKVYFKNPAGLLLTTCRWFSGMEAANIIAISYSVNAGYLRDMALRSTGQFIVIVNHSVMKSIPDEVCSQFDIGKHFVTVATNVSASVAASV